MPVDFEDKKIMNLATKVVDVLEDSGVDPAGKAAACRVAATVFSEAVTATTLRANIAQILSSKR